MNASLRWPSVSKRTRALNLPDILTEWSTVYTIWLFFPPLVFNEQESKTGVSKTGTPISTKALNRRPRTFPAVRNLLDNTGGIRIEDTKLGVMNLLWLSNGVMLFWASLSHFWEYGNFTPQSNASPISFKFWIFEIAGVGQLYLSSGSNWTVKHVDGCTYTHGF